MDVTITKEDVNALCAENPMVKQLLINKILERHLAEAQAKLAIYESNHAKKEEAEIPSKSLV